MPAAFYRGYNSPQINSQAQSNTTSGNPGLVYNQPQPSDSMRGWAQMIPSDTRQQTMQNMASQQQQAQGYTAPQMQQSNAGQQQSMAVNTPPQLQQSNPGQMATMQNGLGAGVPQTQQSNPGAPTQFSNGNMVSNYIAPNTDGTAQTGVIPQRNVNSGYVAPRFGMNNNNMLSTRRLQN